MKQKELLLKQLENHGKKNLSHLDKNELQNMFDEINKEWISSVVAYSSGARDAKIINVDDIEQSIKEEVLHSKNLYDTFYHLLQKYSFDIKLSDIQGEFDDDISPDILAQFHASANPDGTNFSAPLSLMARNGNFIIDINWDDYYKTSNVQIAQKGNNASINLGRYEKGKWYNFTFKVKWGWHKALKPMLEIYQDGVLVVDRPYLPNCMNNSNGIYFKVGVYKYDWKNSNTQSTTTKRVVYYRNVKVI